MRAPPFRGARGEPSEHHEAGRVEAERERVLLGRQPVDALQHVGRAGEVGEHGGVREAADEHGAHEPAIAEQRAVVAAGLRQAAWRAPVGLQRFGELQGDGEQDGAADSREEEEQSAPVGDRREQAAEERAGDCGQAAQHRQAPEEADQRGTRVEVAARGLGDHEPDAAGHALHEAGDDEQFDAG